VLINDLIYLGHEADGFIEGNDDAMIVVYIVSGKSSSRLAALWPTVLEPFLADLIPADVKVPQESLCQQSG